MTKKWTHSGAFGHFGTKPKNVQWSWSARSDEKKIVVVTFWQDQFQKRDGKLIYSRPGSVGSDNRPGYRELMENLAWARDNCDGKLHLIIARAKYVNASPRSILECFPSKVVMTLTEFDELSGAFTAEAS